MARFVLTSWAWFSRDRGGPKRLLAGSTVADTFANALQGDVVVPGLSDHPFPGMEPLDDEGVRLLARHGVHSDIGVGTACLRVLAIQMKNNQRVKEGPR